MTLSAINDLFFTTEKVSSMRDLRFFTETCIKEYVLNINIMYFSLKMSSVPTNLK